jgi:hypothetical protein
MQVYRRIQNPYMPQGTPELTNAPTPMYAPGELGCTFSDQNTGRSYLRVKLDSGATSATAIGAVAAGQLAFWKDRANFIVTNDKNQCDVGNSGSINHVAGVFALAVSTAPGTNGKDGLPVQYVCDLIVGGKAVSVAAGAALIGAQATVDTTAGTARVTYTTGVNTAPVSRVLGIFTSGLSSSKANVDLSIGFID